MTQYGDIARLLAGRIEQLAPELFPAGRREGNEWKIGSVAGEAGSSLSVCLRGPRAGVWADFAAGLRGDALDLVADALFNGSKRQALAWALRWLGLSDEAAAEPVRRATAPAAARNDDRADRRTAFASRIFFQAQPTIDGTPVEAYLAGRGIELRELGRQPRALRYHPALPCIEAGRNLPAMVAAVVAHDGKFKAVHRTWLEPGPDGWRKATLAAPKKVLGTLAGGSIRLWRGATGRPLAQAPDGESVVVCEGIETGLSIALACPERRVIAAVSIANMRGVVLPPAVTEVIIAADNDPPGSEAATALQCAIDHFMLGDRSVRIARSPIGADFNDLLTGLVMR